MSMNYFTTTLAEAVIIGDRLVDSWSRAAEITDEEHHKLKATCESIKLTGPKGIVAIQWNPDGYDWQCEFTLFH